MQKINFQYSKKYNYYQLAKGNFIGHYYPIITQKKISKKQHISNIQTFQLIYQSIIFQMPNNSNRYPKKLMDIIINSTNDRKFSLKNILDFCDKNYIYYNDIFAAISNNIDKYFIKWTFDFSNINEIRYMYFSTYDHIDFSEQYLINEAKKFKLRNKNANALVIQVQNDLCILCINSSRFNEATVYHEFMYILQKFFNILFLKDINYSIPINNAFKNIPQEKINQIFQINEIIPNIITLCLNIEDLNNSNYSKMINYFNYLISLIETKDINNFNIQIKKFIDNKFSINGLIILYLSFNESKTLYVYLKNYINTYIEKIEFFN